MEQDVKRETKDPSTLPEDIFRLLEEGVTEVSEENVAEAGDLFMQVLRSRLIKREEKRGEEVIRFSSLGKPDRQLWYQANMPDKAEKLSGKLLHKFLYGDVIEILLLFLAKEAGHEVTHTQHEVDVDGVKGHTDCQIDGICVDVKSASPYSFGKFKDGSFVFADAFGYVPQLSGYATALRNTDRAGFLVSDKVSGDITFAEIDSFTIAGNPPAPRIAHLRDVVNRNTPPDRCYPDEPEGKSGNRKLGVSCSYCPFREECWKDSNSGKGLRTFWYSRGPVFLTHVAREPKVNEGL